MNASPGDKESEHTLPLMKSLSDAVELSRERQDPFFVSAFMIQAWLGEVTCRAVAEYSEKKLARERGLQTGIAREVFDRTFGHASDEEFPTLFGHVARFAEYGDPQCGLLRDAYWALGCEGEITRPVPPRNSAEWQAGIAKMRGMMARLSDWVEARIHQQTHLQSYQMPVAFDADPARREVATLGVLQRHFPALSDAEKEHWSWRHESAAAEHGASSAWPVLGKAMADPGSRQHEYPALDYCVIGLWPLVMRHNWTYRDLRRVLARLLDPPLPNPALLDGEMAAYCANVLGLRKGKAGRSRAGKKQLPGEDEALRIFGRGAGGTGSTSF